MDICGWKLVITNKNDHMAEEVFSFSSKAYQALFLFTVFADVLKAASNIAVNL